MITKKPKFPCDYSPPVKIFELATRIVGGELMSVSIIGLCINIFMFFHFLSLEKLSFYILCTSKTVSNSMSLLVYLCYIGPVNFFFTDIGSTFLNTHIQQVFGFGLYIQGPMTQMIITVNRFLVIIFSPTSVPKYSTHITVAALSLTWLGGIWWSTIPGFEDNCFVPFTFDHVGFYFTECNQNIVKFIASIIVLLAVSNNAMNNILGVKLAISAKEMLGISSEVARNRRRQTTRFFIQSCIQDWLAAIVFGTNVLAVGPMCPNYACMHLTTFAVDSMSYTVDGFVMFLFNFKRANKNSIRSNGPKTIKETSSRIVSSSVTN